MATDVGFIHQRTQRRVSADAVVLIPGIMGSALRAADHVLWGADRLGWYARAWQAPHSSLDELALTHDEQAGRYTRVTATGLVKAPAWVPFMRGFEPYSTLISKIEQEVAAPSAVLQFPYDWRLPVVHNASLLERAAREHLASWRTGAPYRALQRARPDLRPPQLVLVAHSMGGLLARALPDDLDIRAVVTLGTPFDGAAVAATILNTGRGGPIPLPRARLRDVAVTMPGLHDLLPTYRCLDDDAHDTDPRRLTPADVDAFGGSRDLAEASFAFHAKTADRALPGHRALLGTHQATASSLTLRGGVLEAHHHTFDLHGDEFDRDRNGVLIRTVRGGDGTVPESSALPRGITPTTVAQQHGALARADESVHYVLDVIAGRDPNAARLGDGGIGLDLPDLVAAGSQFPVIMTSGVDSPTAATVTVHYEEDPIPVDHPTIQRADGRYRAEVFPDRPGIYRITVAGGGTTAVTQLVLAVDPADPP